MPGSEPERAWICEKTHHGDGPVIGIREMFTGSPREESGPVNRQHAGTDNKTVSSDRENATTEG